MTSLISPTEDGADDTAAITAAAAASLECDAMRQRRKPKKYEPRPRTRGAKRRASAVDNDNNDGEDAGGAADAAATQRRAEIQRIQKQLKRARRIRKRVLDFIDEPDDHVYVLTIDGRKFEALKWERLGRSPEEEIYRLIWKEMFLDIVAEEGAADPSGGDYEHDPFALLDDIDKDDDDDDGGGGGDVATNESAGEVLDCEYTYNIFTPIDPAFVRYVKAGFTDDRKSMYRNFYTATAKQMRAYARCKLDELMF